jgi:hypothetical protein
VRTASSRKTSIRLARPVAQAAEAEGAPRAPGSSAGIGGALALGNLAAVDREGEPGWALTRWSDGAVMTAAMHSTLDLAVARTAARTGEPVVFVERGGEAVVVGALRTRGTPGVDELDQVSIEAHTITLKGARVAIDGSEELSLRSQAAFVVLRAASEIESFADRIVTRAEGVHKLVGRMLRLN